MSRSKPSCRACSVANRVLLVRSAKGSAGGPALRADFARLIIMLHEPVVPDFHSIVSTTGGTPWRLQRSKQDCR